MPTDTHGLDPATVAHDALHAAGYICRGIDMLAVDPVRAALAERFAPAARSCRGDAVSLAAVIAPQLAQATREARQLTSV